MAWQLDRDLYGPERPTVRDIEPLNRVFSESFTDRYLRDGKWRDRLLFAITRPEWTDGA